MTTKAKTNQGVTVDAETAQEVAEALSDADLTKKERHDLEEKQRAIDEARGYKMRTLANGLVDYEALHDHWTSPSIQSMEEHVAGYRSKTSGYMTEPAIVTVTNQ